MAGEPDCGSGWAPSGAGLDGPVRALQVSEVNGSRALYAGGDFSASGETQLAGVARWDGFAWTPLGTGLNGQVFALAVENAQPQAGLIAGGAFDGAVDGTPGTAFIARWDGQSWSPVGSGVNGPVRAIGTHDIGAGPRVYVGGFFTQAQDLVVRRIAQWDGSSWAPLGAGLNGGVLALAAWNDGSGMALYVAGAFTIAGETPAQNIARWNGATWSALAPAGLAGAGGFVRALEVFGPPGAEHLYAGGSFSTAGGGAAANIARWNGFSWAPLSSGIVGLSVDALEVFDDGSGAALFAAGEFSLAGGIPAAHVARWNGQSWESLGSGLDAAARALTTFDESASGRAPALHVGGEFTTAGGSPAMRVARWGAFGCIGPVITRQPQDVTAAPGARVELDVVVAGSEPLSFQWRHEGVPLADGGPIWGSSTATLVIDPVSVLWQGDYDVIVTGPGGAVISEPAALIVAPACPGDATGDGRVNFIDVSAVLVDWGTVYPPQHGTGSGDANGDGIVSFLDITVILANWGRDC